MGRLRSITVALAVAWLAATAAPAPARAESLLWTLVATPLSATTGSETTFTLTATNEDVLEPLDTNREIGCVVVDVPSNFTVAAATVTGSNAGGSWSASLSGNRVRVQAGSGGDRLELLQWVRFTVRATPQAPGSLAWSSRSYRDQGCGGSGSLPAVPPIIVVSGQPVTPTPQPTATPTPLPTVAPTVRPTPLPTWLPTPLPTLPPIVLPTLLPSETPTDRPTASPTPRPSGASPSMPGSSSSDPAGSTDGSLPPASGSGGPTSGGSPGLGGAAPTNGNGPGAGGTGAAPPIEPALRIDTNLLFGIGSFEWVVPAAVVGVPGLLVILAWVAAQTGAALIWIPAVRRFREERRRMRLGVRVAG